MSIRFAMIAVPVLALSSVHARVAGAQSRRPREACVLTGTPASVEHVVIAPRGVAPFTLDLHAVPIEVRPGAVPRYATVHADGVLRFDGISSAVPYAIARTARAANGVVTISTLSSLSRVRGLGASLVVDAALGFGVSARTVRVPCNAVSLGEPASSAPTTASSPPPGDDTYWIPRGRDLVFTSAPGAGVALHVHADTRVLLSMARVAHRGAWSRLRWDGEGGAGLDGWVSDAAIEPMPLGSVGGEPTGIGHLGCADGGSIGGTGVYRGPARLVPGATVFAERGRGAWATVAQAATVRIVRVGDEPWVEVVSIEGLAEPLHCSTLHHAFVPAEAVELPEGAHWQ